MILVALSVLIAGCSLPDLASVSVADPSLVTVIFRDVSVFDGTALLEHQDVLVTGAEIQALSPTGRLQVLPTALEIAGTGRTLLPGLIDSHMHLFSAGEKEGRPPSPESIASAFLFAGVTSALVAAGFNEVATLREASLGGQILAPRLFTAGPGLTAPGGYPIPLLRAMLPWPISWFATQNVLTAADAAEARTKVRQVIAQQRPDFFKIVFDDLPPGSPHLSREALRAAIAAARRQGVRTIVHATIPEDVMEAIDAGASLLAHVPQRGVLSDEQVARIRASGVPVVTTVRLVSASHELAARGPTSFDRLMFERALLDPWLEDPRWNLRRFSEEFDRRQPEVATITATNFRKLLAAGVPVFAGTDSGVHGVFPGASLHYELRLLVELGMPPAEALRAATSAPAAFLDPDPAAAFGRIAPGQRADLLMVRGNPVDDIEALNAIEEVFLNGIRLQRNELE